jgi:site-specific DNA-methyltransferase (adenine-specific)
MPEYRQYLHLSKGVPLQDLWVYQPHTKGCVYALDECIDEDVKWIGKRGNNKERLNYPTQKPKTLLERIIKASSHEGDLVLDAFCGCGTTVDAAEGLKRRWIGIDISPLALSVIKRRLNDTYQGDLCKFEVRGIPTDEASAIKLWEQNAFAFQDWWITEFEAFSSTFGKKGADKGVDGIALYQLPLLDDPLRVAFQVKGGDKVQSKDIDALIGAMVKHKCELGVFLTRAEPTKPMLDTVAQMGYYEFNKWSYPKVQILTLAEYFAGKVLKLPKNNVTFKSANTLGKNEEQQDLI